MMKFRTEISLSPNDWKISHKDHLLLLGSCFAENIGEKLKKSGFQSDVNPFGVLYNPISVASGLESLLSGKIYSEKDLFEHNGLYSSFSHHSKFSALTASGCLENINQRMLFSTGFLRKASVLIITFGTSYVYRFRKSGQVISNCHKLPSENFMHERLTVQEIVSVWKPLINKLRVNNPGLRILFTVSPIRHWKDGAHENQLSKSILLLAIQEIGEKYFPSYEIMLDDLRDYRYYAEDMLHPSSVAIDYIWGKFSSVYFDQETDKAIAEYNSIRQALQHRPFNPESDVYKTFLADAQSRLVAFEQKYLTDNGKLDR